MNKPFVAARALVLALVPVALAGCPQPAGTTAAIKPDAPPAPAATATAPTPAPMPTPEPESTPAPIPAPEPPPPAAPAAIVYFVESELWRVEPDGSRARPLGLSLEPDGPDDGGAVGQGDSTPTVSPDGHWLAWADETDLWLVELTPDGVRPGDDKKGRKITRMPRRKQGWIVAADISFSTWSPDSSTLLVILSEPGYEEESPLPLPRGVEYGFHVLRPPELALVRAPHIDGFYGWTPDSKAVLDSRSGGPLKNQLIANPVDPGPIRVLHDTSDGYGHSQLIVNGDWVAWNSSIGGSQIFVLPTAGGEPRAMSAKGAFADIQWPTVAPDGAHVTYRLHGNIQLGAGNNTADKPLPIQSDPRWFDASHLLVITAEGLVVMDLDGKTRVLDPRGTALVRQ